MNRNLFILALASLSSMGILASCGGGSSSSGGETPSSVKKFAYITNMAGNSYTQCEINESGIESSTCNTVTPTGSGTLDYPRGLAYNGHYMYIINGTSNSYTKCDIGNNGIESQTCNTIVPTGNGALNNPMGIASSGSYIYVTLNSNKLIECNTSHNGLESSTCINVTPTISGASILKTPFGITFDGNHAYITNVGVSGMGSLTQCQVANNLIESSLCTTSAAGSFSAPQGITTYNEFAYILTGNNYKQCKIGGDGVIDITACSEITPSGDGALNSPRGIVIH